MYSTSQQYTSIDSAKLLQLKRDLETLQPGQGQSTGHQQIIEILKPIVQDALARGCSVNAIAGLLQHYKLDINPSALGITKPY
ncbi:MAG: hypothetical protein Kow00121_60560 [Elainellaceae cyanobacterium]